MIPYVLFPIGTGLLFWLMVVTVYPSTPVGARKALRTWFLLWLWGLATLLLLNTAGCSRNVLTEHQRYCQSLKAAADDIEKVTPRSTEDWNTLEYWEYGCNSEALE